MSPLVSPREQDEKQNQEVPFPSLASTYLGNNASNVPSITSIEVSPHEYYLTNISKIRHDVTPENCSEMYSDFLSLFDIGVEYVAIDSELTGIYTEADANNHLLKLDYIENNNTNKLFQGVRENRMFQLGLTIKTNDGCFSIWRFHLCPDLKAESFTPDMFREFFIENSRGVQEKFKFAHECISEYSSKAIRPVDMRHFLSTLFVRKPTIIFFDGYLDLMHLLKAYKKPFAIPQVGFRKNPPFKFYDTKYMEEVLYNSTLSLEYSSNCSLLSNWSIMIRMILPLILC